MSLSKPRLVAALAVIVVGAAAASCSPRLASGGLSMTPAQMDSVLAATTWSTTGCTTVDRVAVRPQGTTAPVTTAVRICPAANARVWGPGNAPKNGVPVATMHNTGSYIEAKWGLEPNDHYVIWVEAAGAGRARYIIRQGQEEIVSGPYIGCKHNPATADSTAFGNCRENPYPLVGGQRSRGPSAGADDKFEHTLLDRDSGPAWISCTEGCCTTGAN